VSHVIGEPHASTHQVVTETKIRIIHRLYLTLRKDERNVLIRLRLGKVDCVNDPDVNYFWHDFHFE
jgi:hypothetical protein